jgi:hypothetical protein
MPPRLRRVFEAIAALPMSFRIVLVFAAVVHAVGIGWGMPASDAWDVDGVAPRDILPGIAETFSPGDFYTYPPLQLLIVGLLTLPVTIVAVLRAPSHALSDVIHEIVKPPYMTTITITARLCTFAMSLGIVTCIGLIAAEIASKERKASTMTAAGLFASLNWSFAYYSHTSNLDVPYLFWAFLGILALTRAIVRHEPRRIRSFAIFAALAVATKDQAYAMFLVGAPAALALWFARDAWARTQARAIVREALIAVAIALVLLLLIDGAVTNPAGFERRIAFLTGPASKDFEILSRDATGRILAFVDSYLYFRRHYPWPVAFFVVVGIPVTFQLTRKPEAFVPLFIALSFSLAFNMTALRTEERFTLPQMLSLAVYAGFGIEWLWRQRWVGQAITIVGVALALSEEIRLIATILDEPRYSTEEFLAEVANRDASATIETYGLNVYLPRFPDGAHVTRIGHNDPKKRGVVPGIEELQGNLGDIEERKPQFVVVNECFVWRYLERDDLAPTSGHVVPSSQRLDANDPDSTTFFRRLFHEELRYHPADISKITSFERSWLHSSLGCPMYVFQRDAAHP